MIWNGNGWLAPADTVGSETYGVSYLLVNIAVQKDADVSADAHRDGRYPPNDQETCYAL